MSDYNQLTTFAEAAKAAHPGNPWYYQEKSDAYTHIVRVDNPRLNNSMIVVQLSQRTDGVSEAIARYIAAINPDVFLAILAERTELLSQLEICRNQLAESHQAYHRLIEHTNECENQLDDAAALLIDIAKSGEAHRECTDKNSSTGAQIAAIANYVSQFQPEAHPPEIDDATERDNWHMNPCVQGHRDVGAAGGVAQCYQCKESITAETTQAAFEQWNATHPPASAAEGTTL